jgi:hypothetical protein
MCSENGSHPDKDALNVLPTMAKPNWLPTAQTATPAGAPLGSDIEHYGKQLLIRRVDGLPLNPHNSGSNIFQQMGFRMTSEVYFKVRKVQ